MDNSVHDAQRLKELQALPLERKIQITQNRIQEWYMHWNGKVYISFSGGKDSTVLATLARQLYQNIPVIFCNTGLEFSSIQKFAKDFGATQIFPKMSFQEVISTYGYPLISKEVAEAIYYARRIRNNPNVMEKEAYKRQQELLGLRTEHNYKNCSVPVPSKSNLLEGTYSGCQDGKKSMFNKEKWLVAARDLPIMISHYCCSVMKKRPMSAYGSSTGGKPIIGTLADESRIRKQAWIRHGCNAFDSKKPSSQPMSFWTEQDVLTFIKESNIKIADVYGDICLDDNKNLLYCSKCSRTGCTYCMFGAHMKGDTRFLQLAEIEPKKYDYCMKGGQWVDNPKYDATAPVYDGAWKNWNPKKIWVPSKEGLGLKQVLTMFNELYPNNKIIFE